MGFQPPFARVYKRRVPAPCVNASHADAARRKIQRGLSSHPATGGEILVSADATGSAGINQHNIEWMKFVANAFKLSLDFRGSNHMPVGQMPKIELDAGTEEPVEWNLDRWPTFGSHR